MNRPSQYDKLTLNFVHDCYINGHDYVRIFAQYDKETNTNEVMFQCTYCEDTRSETLSVGE